MGLRQCVERSCRQRSKVKCNQLTERLGMSARSLGTRKSERLLERTNSDKLTDTMCHFDKLPNEIVLHIFELVGKKGQVQLRKTCTRFRDLILSSTTRVDQTLMQVDPDIRPRQAMQLILDCPRLKVLSLIDSSSSPATTRPYLNSLISYSSSRNEIGDLMSLKCPLIESIDVASLEALRLVKRYVERLNGSSQLTSLRVFSSNVQTVVSLLLGIIKYSPKMSSFKLLRRTHPKTVDVNCEEKYHQLWTLMGQQLITFSINVKDRHVLANCFSLMPFLQRIVIWHLEENDVLALVTNSKSLRTVILMNCAVGAFKHLIHLPQLTDLTFHVNPYEKVNGSAHSPPRLERITVLPPFFEFYETFRKIGGRLTRLVLVLKDLFFDSRLSPIAEYCTNVVEMKLKEINQSDYHTMYTIIKKLPRLVRLHWQDNWAFNYPEQSGGRIIIEDLIFDSPSLCEVHTIHCHVDEVTGEPKTDLSKAFKYYLVAKRLSLDSSSSSEEDIEIIPPYNSPKRDQFTVKCISAAR